MLTCQCASRQQQAESGEVDATDRLLDDMLQSEVERFLTDAPHLPAYLPLCMGLLQPELVGLVPYGCSTSQEVAGSIPYIEFSRSLG